MKKRKYRSVITKRITRSVEKIGLTVFGLFLVLSLGRIEGTNSFLADMGTASGNTLSAGYWIPTLAMSVDPASPDDENGFYETTPCVTLSADINGETGGITIYYEFSSDGDPVNGGTAYSGTCVPVPDGDPVHFQAQAVNDLDPDWKSNRVSRNFKVDTVPEEEDEGVEAGDVVINEVMWMGSSESTSDEWIELRNTTDHEIDLGQWEILNAKHNGNNRIRIPASRSIPAHGFFLLANYSNSSSNSALAVSVDEVNASLELLNSGNGHLVLYDSDGNIIDQAKGDSWPEGYNSGGVRKAMERNNSPGNGLDAGSWHTCVADACNDTEYWDSEGNDYGTPKHSNLSENDPTAEDYDPLTAEEDEENSEETEEPEMADAEEAIVIVPEVLPAEEAEIDDPDENLEAVVDDPAEIIPTEAMPEEPEEEEVGEFGEMVSEEEIAEEEAGAVEEEEEIGEEEEMVEEEAGGEDDQEEEEEEMKQEDPPEEAEPEAAAEIE